MNEISRFAVSEELEAQVVELARRHHARNTRWQGDAATRLRRFLNDLDIHEGDLADALTERNFRRYARISPKQLQSIKADVSLFRSLATTLAGERIDLRRPTKPRPKHQPVVIADIEAAANRIVDIKDAAGAAALIAVLADVRFEAFPEITSTRELLDRQLHMPIAFRQIANRLLDDLPDADVGRVSVATWQRARSVPIDGRPDLLPMAIRLLRNRLLADELGLPVAELLRQQLVLPITRADELSPQSLNDRDWCRLLEQRPLTERLLEEIRDTERGPTMANRPLSRTASRQRAKELADRHENPPPLPPSYSDWLAQYSPEAPDVAPQWNETREVVFEVARRVQKVTSLTGFKRVVGTVAKAFAHAAANGRSIDPADVLSERNINWHVGQLRGSDQTRATYRSDLRRAARYWPGTGIVERPQQMVHKSIQMPYSASESRTLSRVIRSQPTTVRGVQARAYFGLGLGAGLRSKEILKLHTTSFRLVESCDVLVVDVPDIGDKPGRTVPVLPEWRDLVEQGISDSPGPFVTETGKNHVGASYKRLKTKSKHPPIVQDRLRNTWLTALMGSPDISLATLLRIAGLCSARSLEGLVEYVPVDKAYDQVVDAAAGEVR